MYNRELIDAFIGTIEQFHGIADKAALAARIQSNIILSRIVVSIIANGSLFVFVKPIVALLATRFFRYLHCRNMMTALL